ncbi:type II secretion system protein GspE [Candidatus Pacearchaeota archaeon]|nr:MAG: type II secretion system protein GspE [Candidatus Pacearchaeota archaeon]
MKDFIEKLKKKGIENEKDILKEVENFYKIKTVSTEEVYKIDESILPLIPKEIILKYRVLPYKRKGKKLYVLTSEPKNFEALEVIKFATGFEPEFIFALPSAIEEFISRRFVREIEKNNLKKYLLDEKREIEKEEIVREIEEGPIINLVEKILTEALEKKASDIHIEPYKDVLRVRYRIDGVLHTVLELPPSLKDPLITRFKIISRLKIEEKRLPQDGRIRVKKDGIISDFRISTIPTVWGEKIAIRVLGHSFIDFNLEALGMEKEVIEVLRKNLKKRTGMIVVSGPTGGGKTTTLYSLLNELDATLNNISTVEDPVEYIIEGVNQFQVKEEIGLTFPNILKAILRQDPDIIMVGEIRDEETAQTAIRAALTGHLVLTSLHANTSAGVIIRFLEMGIKPYLLASTLLVIINQRLVKKLCPYCKTKKYIESSELIELELEPGFYNEPQGCPKCYQTGFLGRTGIFEALVVNEKVKNLIVSKADEKLIKEAGVIIDLKEAAKRKVRRGEITLKEAYKALRMAI